MPTFPAVSTIAQTIQLSLSPIFMLAGIATFVNVLAGRLARVVDRGRALEALHPRSSGPEHDRHVWELRVLDRRIHLINLGLLLAVLSAVTTCVVVTLLFVGELTHLLLDLSELSVRREPGDRLPHYRELVDIEQNLAGVLVDLGSRPELLDLRGQQAVGGIRQPQGVVVLLGGEHRAARVDLLASGGAVAEHDVPGRL